VRSKGDLEPGITGMATKQKGNKKDGNASRHAKQGIKQQSLKKATGRKRP
jgi:hypothetical protein